jgi:hypothetical protein
MIEFMKAFNVNQPWAELIISGRKKIEVRDWSPRNKGLYAVRSTKTVLEHECNKHRIDCTKVPKGLIVGTVEIFDIIIFTRQLWEDLRDEHLVDGPFIEKKKRKTKGWRLKNPKRLEIPIKAKSNTPLRGMFDLKEETVEEIRKTQK